MRDLQSCMGRPENYTVVILKKKILFHNVPLGLSYCNPVTLQWAPRKFFGDFLLLLLHVFIPQELRNTLKSSIWGNIPIQYCTLVNTYLSLWKLLFIKAVPAVVRGADTLLEHYQTIASTKSQQGLDLEYLWGRQCLYGQLYFNHNRFQTGKQSWSVLEWHQLSSLFLPKIQACGQFFQPFFFSFSSHLPFSWGVFCITSEISDISWLAFLICPVELFSLAWRTVWASIWADATEEMQL